MQELAPAADQLVPKEQGVQFVLAVTVQAEARNVPAAHVDEAQFEHGA